MAYGLPKKALTDLFGVTTSQIFLAAMQPLQRRVHPRAEAPTARADAHRRRATHLQDLLKGMDHLVLYRHPFSKA